MEAKIPKLSNREAFRLKQVIPRIHRDICIGESYVTGGDCETTSCYDLLKEYCVSSMTSNAEKCRSVFLPKPKVVEERYDPCKQKD